MVLWLGEPDSHARRGAALLRDRAVRIGSVRDGTWDEQGDDFRHRLTVPDGSQEPRGATLSLRFLGGSWKFKPPG